MNQKKIEQIVSTKHPKEMFLKALMMKIIIYIKSDLKVNPSKRINQKSMINIDLQRLR